MDVRAACPCQNAFIFFRDLEGLTEVFGRMSAGTSGRKLPLWADFLFPTAWHASMRTPVSIALFFFVGRRGGACKGAITAQAGPRGMAPPRGAVVAIGGSLKLRYFRNPCDHDPPTRNFKNFAFFNNVLKILNVYF